MRADERHLLNTLFRQVEHLMSLTAALTTSVQNNTAATTAAVAALTAGGANTPDADVQAAITAIDANTAALTNAEAPPAPPAS